MAENTLVRVGQLPFRALDELLQLGDVTGLVDLDQGLPGVVVTAGPGQQIVVDYRVITGARAEGREQARGEAGNTSETFFQIFRLVLK